MGNALLYFTYDAHIDPARLRSVAPEASFEFIAHLPEWILEYTIPNGTGGLPSVRPMPGNTVWGAVFSVADDELAAIDASEAAEGRVPTTAQVMDREGRRHDVVTHVSGNGHHETLAPEASYVRLMVSGGRHWKLPAGWVMALEEHLA
jgi:gamma-glutamylcyclotransferase